MIKRQMKWNVNKIQYIIHVRKNNSLEVLGSDLNTSTNKEVYNWQFRKILEFCSVMISVNRGIKDYYGGNRKQKKCHCVLIFT